MYKSEYRVCEILTDRLVIYLDYGDRAYILCIYLFVCANRQGERSKIKLAIRK